MPITDERCSCGQPLHYSDPEVEQAVAALVAEQGPTLPVQIEGTDVSYRVPRHYIALHGLKAWELSELAGRYGWERVR